MKTGWHKYFIYFSLIFLIVVLYKANYLEIPHIYSPASLFLAFMCLFGGFMANTIAQQQLLEKHSFHISIRQALAMEGLNIFNDAIEQALAGFVGGPGGVGSDDEIRDAGCEENVVGRGRFAGKYVEAGSGNFSIL